MAMPKEKLTRRLEDYLEAVLLLVQDNGVARVRDIAARTHVNKSTVTAALKQLAQAGLINHDPYQFVTLTERGKRAAGTILGRHEALVRFLVEVLDMDKALAEENACRMEHVVDDKLLARLNLLGEFIGQYSFDREDWLERFSAYCRQHRSGHSSSNRQKNTKTSDRS